MRDSTLLRLHAQRSLTLPVYLQHGRNSIRELGPAAERQKSRGFRRRMVEQLWGAYCGLCLYVEARNAWSSFCLSEQFKAHACMLSSLVAVWTVTKESRREMAILGFHGEKHRMALALFGGSVGAAAELAVPTPPPQVSLGGHT